MKNKIWLSSPHMGGSEQKYVNDVLPAAEQLLELLKGLEFDEDYTRTKAQIELFREAEDGDGEKACWNDSLGRA